MEIEGKLTEKHPVVQVGANSKDKMTFVIKSKGTYPKDVYFETFNAGLISFIGDTNLETEILVQFDISSRTWTKKGTTEAKWFTSAMAWKAEVIRSEAVPNNETGVTDKPTAGIDTGKDEGDDLPF